MSDLPQRVTIQIPASTSNLGPGFDCLGIALGIYNRVTVERVGVQIDPPHAMVKECARMFFKRTRAGEFPFQWSIEGDIPASRGLGASMTVRLGILSGLNILSGKPLSCEGLFALCSEMEGHPDSAGAAMFGGFVVVNAKGDYLRFPVAPELKFILLVPETEVLTEIARRVLPPAIPLKECAMNISYACALTAAFATGQYEKLRGNFEDFLHQRYRAPLIPGMFEIIHAGVGSGALGGFLSGSGSAVCCLAMAGHENLVATAMRQAYPDPTRCTMRITTADNEGTRCLDPS